MNCTRRVYVEKMAGYDNQAQHILSDLRENLHIDNLDNIRLLNRYDVEGLDEEQFAKAVDSVFSEPAVDSVSYSIDDKGSNIFAVEYLPGQFDQRADSAIECIGLICSGARPKLKNARVYILSGDISKEDIADIKDYLINPVEAHEVTLDEYETLDVELPVPQDIEVINGFCEMNDKECESFKNDYGLAMSIADVIHVRNYFANIKRDPFVTEIRVLDTYWSDHCRHTTFSTIIEDIDIEDSEFLDKAKETLKEYRGFREELYCEKITHKPECLMDAATIAVKILKKKGALKDLDESEEINACSIKIDVDVNGETEPWLLMFKNETHNHPTEIEPFGGAATCLGGAIRDPLSGRSYVYQAMRVTGCADPTVDVTNHLPGKLPQRVITTKAAHGYSSYGNQIGLATGQVCEVYDPSYVAKRMEIGAVIAAAPAENVVRERPAPGDVVVLLGGATGRDGCGGATGSSKAHTTESIEVCGAEVQKGNAPTERKLQRLFRNKDASKLIKRCNDFGAGGVCVAIGELADSLIIDLDKVPRKYDGLDGTELAISESQERMAVVLAPDDVDEFVELALEENLSAVKVADVTDNGRLIMTWRGKECLNIDRSFIDTNGASQYTKVVIAAPNKEFYPFEKGEMEHSKDIWLKKISSLKSCSQRGLVEMFDSSIGAGTVLMPYGGKYQLTPTQSMAAKIPMTEGETNTCSIMSFGFFPEIFRFSPYHGSIYSVLESLLRQNITGGDYSKCYLSFQEYFERLRNDAKRWGKPMAALLGALDAQLAMGVGAIGGKDSMSGSFEDIDVVPTLVSFAVSTADISNIISPEIKDSGNQLILIETPIDENGLPDYSAFKENCKLIKDNIDKGNIISAHTISEAGIADTITKMSIGNKIGVHLDISSKEMYAPKYLSVVAEIANGTKINSDNVKVIGKTTNNDALSCDGVILTINEALKASGATLEDVFPVQAETDYKEIETINYCTKSIAFKGSKVAVPKVVIPVFPGTNCEYDTSRAFTDAGAQCSVLIFKNCSKKAIEESILQLASLIDQSQILMIPGGFSLGDEPEGSGKYIANVLSSGRVAESITNLLDKRDGLILGICNGFQALVKVGLVPYGKIIPMTSESPTLTFNSIGRHQSRIVHTKVASNLSPWLSGKNVGDVISVPISHGEGKFVCSDDVLKMLIANGQIASQYVDLSGNATYNIDYNPNGSIYAIEGITSPDGRVLGKMGHNERFTNGTFKNVAGNYDSRIFVSGVKYFK